MKRWALLAVTCSFLLTSLTFSELTDEQYTLKMKNLKEESQRITAEYNDQKSDFEREFNKTLQGFTNSPEDQENKIKFMENSETKRSEMKKAFKDKMEFIRKTQEELRTERLGMKEGQLTPEENRKVYEYELLKQNRSMQSISERIRKQDEQSRQEEKAMMNKIEEAPKQNLEKKPELTVAPAISPKVVTPQNTSPFKSKKKFGY